MEGFNEGVGYTAIIKGKKTSSLSEPTQRVATAGSQPLKQEERRNEATQRLGSLCGRWKVGLSGEGAVVLEEIKAEREWEKNGVASSNLTPELPIY